MKKFSSITRVNSHHTSRAKKIKIIVITGLCLLMLLFVVPKLVASVTSVLFIPIHKLETWFLYSSDALPQFFRERSSLIDELNTFKYSQSAQSGDRLTSQLLTEENKELRALLNENGEKRTLAGIIGRPNTVPYDVLILDKGSDDGIKEGSPVFIGNNAVIGVVQKVFSQSSVAVLVTTPGFKTSVYIIGPNVYTNAEGVGGGQLKIGVPQGIQLNEGNLVILPGVGSGIYGAVTFVDSIPSEPEQYAYVSPEMPLSSLRLVSVGESPLQSLSFEEAQQAVAEAQTDLFVVPIPEGVLVTIDIASTTSSTTASSTPQATTTTP